MKTRKLKIGDVDVISLRGNPTSGYSWEIEYDDKFLEVTRVIDRMNGRSGSSSIFKYKINPIRKGKTSIELFYYKPWEGKDTAIKHEAIEYEINE